MKGKLNIASRGLVVAAAGVLTALALVWSLRPGEGSSAPATAGPESEASHEPGNGHTDDGRPTDSATQHLLSPPEIDLSRTSWQNPFDAGCWRSAGWRFSPEAMRCDAGPPAEASFRRTYRELSLELQFESLGERPELEIRLDTPAAETSTTIALSRTALVVSAESPARRGVIDRRALPAAVSGQQPSHLRLGTTGNRLRLLWNGRPLLTCAQPARQSGREMTVTFVSRGTGLRITGLRLEGR